MRFENETFENINNRKLDRISEKYPSIDIREGSMVYNAVAANSVETANLYVDLENTLNESYAETATREYLLRACREVGLDTERYEPTHGVFLGKFNVEVPIGSRWNNDMYNFETIAPMQSSDEFKWYRLRSETAGSAPNIIVGDLTALDTVVTGLQNAFITECLVLGENETPDGVILEEYFETINSHYGDGNISQYERWCRGFDGIGSYRVIPVWNGRNTVKVLILNVENEPASSVLISDFQLYLDPPAGVLNDDSNRVDYPQGRGLGNGVAPIGAIVTVDTSSELPLEIVYSATLQSGYLQPEGVGEAIKSYLKDIAFVKSAVNYMSIGAAILSCKSIDSLLSLTINGVSTDLPLSDNQVATLGTLTFREVGE